MVNREPGSGAAAVAVLLGIPMVQPETTDIECHNDAHVWKSEGRHRFLRFHVDFREIRGCLVLLERL